MSKATQPIGGPPTAPSPGLPQPAYPSAPTAPVVFGPPQAPQMNTQSQPRPHYYQGRAQPPSNATRVQAGSSARAVPPAHVYPAGSQVMMIPSQLSYPSQSYYIQGQGRSYVVPTQQYSVQPGAPGFFPSASPTEYGTYAGAYYPAQQQFPTAVPGAQVMMNQSQAIPPKRERKTIRIRDPNQGGKDVTDEILSGGRTTSTPTPPQSAGSGSEAQANGESVHVPIVVRPDDGGKITQVLMKPSESPSPPLPPPEAEANVPDTCEQDLRVDNTTPLLLAPNSMEVPLLETVSSQVVQLPETPTPQAIAIVEDTTTQVMQFVELPASQTENLPEAATVQPLAENSTSPPVDMTVSQVAPEEALVVAADVENKIPAIGHQPAADPGPVEFHEPTSVPTQEEVPVEPSASPAEPHTNGLPMEHPVIPAPPQSTSVCQPEPALDSPIAQPEELLTNGDGASGQQDTEVQDSQPEAHVSPISEPEEKSLPPSKPLPDEDKEKEVPAQAEAAPQAPKESTEPQVQVAVSAPKKKRKMKDLNKKEAVGDLLDAFKEQVVDESSDVDVPVKPSSAAPQPEQGPSVLPEEQDETWEEKEDKLDAENIKPGDHKYKYKEEQWKPINPEDKKSYDREFLLGFQFIVASMQKPEGLPQITDVVLDKANKTPLRPLDPARLTGMNCGPDFTPSFANLGRPAMGNRGPPAGMGPRRSQQGPRKEPRKIIATVSLNENVQLNKAEKAWKPINKQQRASEEDDPENIKTQELFRRVRSILNKLTPQMFQQLMKQVTDLAIDTEDRLKGVIDLIFEKAISEPNFSVAYANMCRCLMGLKVPTTDKPGVTVNFRKLLLNRCQKEFEKDKDDDEVFEKKQKELDAASSPEEKTRLSDELVEARDSARRRSLGNIKFIGELFKLKMLTEAIMHDCVVKLLKNHDEESLECLCRLLSTIGKDLDFERAKPRMDQYFNQMDKIIHERKTSSRIRFMLQDVIDLRMCNWVPRRGEQGPKTIDQIHKEAELEKQREQVKVQHLMSKQDKRREPQGRPTGGRGKESADDGWNTVPISKGSRPIDTSRLSKITKLGPIDSNQLLAPGGRLSWGKGSSGGTGAKPAESASEPGRPATSTLNRFSALQQSSVSESQDARRPVQRGSSSRDRSEKERGDRFDKMDRFDKSDFFERPDRSDAARPLVTKRSYSKETEDRSRERGQIPQEAVRKVASMTEPRDRSKETVRKDLPVSAAPAAPAKPSMSEEELEKKSNAIIEEYLHINDMKEALQCVQELNSPTLLFVFVRNVIESTLERSTIAREHTGLLLYQLVKAGTLPKDQYFKGVLEVLEVADDMAIDIPHIWTYLGELISPVLREGGIPMGELFREVTKPLVPIGKAGVLLAEILTLQCKEMSQKKAGMLWQESGLNWSEFLSKDQDVNKFLSEKNLEYTQGEETEPTSKKELSSEELNKVLTRLLKENSSNQKIFDWIEANLSDQQIVSSVFIRQLMTAVCHSAIIFENPYRVDVTAIHSRAKLLQKYLSDETKELQALYALQALVVKLDQPPNLLRMFFDALYDEDVIKEEPFYKWESSKDPAEQQGKGVALKSVTAFFTWLREAEDESDN